jgi:diacylglycerol kinase
MPNRSQQYIHERRIRLAKDKRAAAVFWWILMACRLVIPLYVAYAIYLYWTLPVAVRYSGGGY